MLTPNRYGSNPMIKIRRKNYLFEKNQKINIDNEIKVGGMGSTKKNDEIWRVRAKELKDDPETEQKYQLNQIVKKYNSNKDELKGYDYKYILELTDLLAKKDNNFSKKRLELYNRRINSKKNLDKLELDKSLSQLYRTTNHLDQKPKLQGDKLNKNPITFMTYIYGNNKINRKNNYYNTFYKGRNKNNNSFNNQNNQNFYYKTSYNYNSPLRIKSLKYLLSDSKNKSWGKDIIKNNSNNNTNTGILITQYNNNVEDDFDNISLVGKEDFLISRDKEKYHEYLNKQYNFFNQPKLIQIKYLYEKQKRVKLFKKMPNAKYLLLKKEDPLKTEIFRRINREKNNIYFDVLKNMEKNNNKKTIDRLKNKSFNKGYFYKECKNIMMNVKKYLQT